MKQDSLQMLELDSILQGQHRLLLLLDKEGVPGSSAWLPNSILMHGASARVSLSSRSLPAKIRRCRSSGTPSFVSILVLTMLMVSEGNTSSVRVFSDGTFTKICMALNIFGRFGRESAVISQILRKTIRKL
ncbi:hypothetical protein H0E87_026524 [Populus deltoides]|uniref:Uncharacterized protein n=1 Tax=Populus deltoides TaxID=3696 RepID=A0A8T2WTX7_POPDE|nr:hypothetical protein H0E87_026524 [Populus deltoides]